MFRHLGSKPFDELLLVEHQRTGRLLSLQYFDIVLGLLLPLYRQNLGMQAWINNPEGMQCNCGGFHRTTAKTSTHYLSDFVLPAHLFRPQEYHLCDSARTLANEIRVIAESGDTFLGGRQLES